jgi:hypothetical protein
MATHISAPEGFILPQPLDLSHREAALLRRTLEYALENCAPDDEPVIANFLDRMDGDRGLEFEYEESTVLRDILQFAADTGPVGNPAVLDSLLSKL